MTEETKTLDNWFTELEIKFRGTPREAARFYNIQILPRLMYTLSKQSRECTHCKSRLHTLEPMMDSASHWMKTDAPELENYQQELNQTMKHLSSVHGIVPKGLWMSKMIVFGLIFGIAIAAIAHLLATSTELPGMLMTGAAIGMITGWFVGKTAENRLRKSGKLF